MLGVVSGSVDTVYRASIWHIQCIEWIYTAYTVPQALPPPPYDGGGPLTRNTTPYIQLYCINYSIKYVDTSETSLCTTTPMKSSHHGLDRICNSGECWPAILVAGPCTKFCNRMYRSHICITFLQNFPTVCLGIQLPCILKLFLNLLWSKVEISVQGKDALLIECPHLPACDLMSSCSRTASRAIGSCSLKTVTIDRYCHYTVPYSKKRNL